MPKGMRITTPRSRIILHRLEYATFARNMVCEEEPFIWNPHRRTLLRAKLDAYYVNLYELTCDELRYILEPTDVYVQIFLVKHETFRVLKNNEIRQFGESRTQRLVLEALDKMFNY